MDTLMKADIFFFVATIASIVLTILTAIALYYIIKAGKNLYAISRILQNNFKDSEEFALELKERLESNFLFKFFFPPARKKTRKDEA
jgi:hypothetical protein